MDFYSKINIGVFGLGAIGSVMATYLDLLPQVDLCYFNRSSKQEINIEGPLGMVISKIQLAPPHPKLDWLIVCIKEYHYEYALIDILKIINPNTKLILIRNGLHLEKSLNGKISNDRILPCMIDCPAEKTGSKIKYYDHPKLTFPKCAIAHLFEAMLENIPIEINLVDDFLSMSWMKLMESSCLGSIMTLNNNTAKIFKIPEFKIHYQKLLEECIKVAKADNANIPNNNLNQMMDKLKSYPDDKGSSMLTDFRNGNQLELNAKNGIVVKLAKQYNIPIPLNQQIYKKLRAINESFNHS